MYLFKYIKIIILINFFYSPANILSIILGFFGVILQIIYIIFLFFIYKQIVILIIWNCLYLLYRCCYMTGQSVTYYYVNPLFWVFMCLMF